LREPLTVLEKEFGQVRETPFFQMKQHPKQKEKFLGFTVPWILLVPF
jgi:hypothetical protein